MDKVEYQKLNNSKIELHAYPSLCMFIFGLFQIYSQHWFPLDIFLKEAFNEIA
jgi:hypothetical protein